MAVLPYTGRLLDISLRSSLTGTPATAAGRELLSPLAYTHASPVSGRDRMIGTVKAGAAPIANARVRIYWRVSGLLAAETITNAAGEFTASGLPAVSGELFAVALDGTHNAAVFDLLSTVV